MSERKRANERLLKTNSSLQNNVTSLQKDNAEFKERIERLESQNKRAKLDETTK